MEQTAIEAPATETRLSDLLLSVRSMFRRRWLSMLLVTLVAFGIGVALIMLMTPHYQATARVRIDPARAPLASSTAQVTDLGSEAIETEVTLMSSPEIAREVVRRLNLLNDSEFAPKPTDGAAPLTAEERQNAVANNVLRKLSVGRERLTYILAVRFTSRDPDKAARIANSFAQAYIDFRVGRRVGTATQQADWFRQRLDQMGAEVRAA
jgi:polysaccharide biosynthesis transport protein